MMKGNVSLWLYIAHNKISEVIVSWGCFQVKICNCFLNLLQRLERIAKKIELSKEWQIDLRPVREPG